MIGPGGPRPNPARPGRHRAGPNREPDRQYGAIIEEDYGLDPITGTPVPWLSALDEFGLSYPTPYYSRS
jgi:hypothetical protein